MFRIGLLVLHTGHPEEGVVAVLKADGLVEGRDFVLERRRAEGRLERLPALAAELVKANVDVVVAYTNAPAFAARDASSTIPIVVWASHDAVGTGLVASLARPGGNVTGVESMAPALDAKRIQFLHETLPSMKRLAVLDNPLDRGTAAHLRYAQDAARAFEVSLLPVDLFDPFETGRARATIEAEHPDALLIFTDPVTNHAFDRIGADARQRRLPTMCEFRELVRRGCLMSYGATLAEFDDRVAHLVTAIRRGAKPSELPMEQPTRFELVLNQTVAREIGVTFLPSLLLRADLVIP